MIFWWQWIGSPSPCYATQHFCSFQAQSSIICHCLAYVTLSEQGLWATTLSINFFSRQNSRSTSRQQFPFSFSVALALFAVHHSPGELWRGGRTCQLRGWSWSGPAECRAQLQPEIPFDAQNEEWIWLCCILLGNASKGSLGQYLSGYLLPCSLTFPFMLHTS